MNDNNSEQRPDISILMRACRAGDLQLAQKALETGADVNAKNRNGTTAYMYAKTAAFGSGSTELLALLLSHGANPVATDNFGKTARDYAQLNADKLCLFLKQAEESYLKSSQS